jgi:hypothetical protein
MPHSSCGSGLEVLEEIGKRTPWVKRFRAVLCESRDARQAFTRLIVAGCDAGDLLFWLSFSCTDVLTIAAVERRQMAHEVSAFAAQLSQVAKRLQKFERSSKNGTILKTFSLPEFQGQSTNLDNLSKSLLNEAQEFRGKMTARESRSLCIAWLAARVNCATGANHYGDLARLIESYHSMNGTDRDISPRAVEKRVKRFREKHPLTYRHARNMTRREYGFPEKPRFVTDGDGGLKYGDLD